MKSWPRRRRWLAMAAAAALALVVLEACATRARAEQVEAPSEPTAKRKPASAPRAESGEPRQVGDVQRGSAAWYGGELHGRPTASGETFDKDGFTAAHRTLPMGATVRVTHVKSGRSVTVRINDRGPYGKRRRIIDVSEAAARELGFLAAGISQVTVEVLTLPEARAKKAKVR